MYNDYHHNLPSNAFSCVRPQRVRQTRIHKHNMNETTITTRLRVLLGAFFTSYFFLHRQHSRTEVRLNFLTIHTGSFLSFVYCAVIVNTRVFMAYKFADNRL